MFGVELAWDHNFFDDHDCRFMYAELNLVVL